MDHRIISSDQIMQQFFFGYVPNYYERMRNYEMHCKKIAEMSFGRFVDLVSRIKPEILAIYQGNILSQRQELYLLSCTAQFSERVAFKKKLCALCVFYPFHSAMAMTLIGDLFSYFFPRPEERVHYTEYMTCVLVPETFIRIYAFENGISYELAEKEMLYNGCYV